MRLGFGQRGLHFVRLRVAGVSCASLLLASSLGEAQSHFPQPDPALRKSVLIILEVGLSHPAALAATRELLTGVPAGTASQVEFYVESLDSVVFADERSQNDIEDALVAKYATQKLDVIVALGPTSIRFLLKSSNTFFPNVPVVFLGSTEEQMGNLTPGSRFTGAWLKLEPDKTLNAVLRLLPYTKHVAIVCGTSAWDKGFEAITRKRLNPYSAHLDLIYLTDLDMGTLLERVRHLPKGTIVLSISFLKDATGKPFLNATTALPLVVQAANVPVFGIADMYLGHGPVGGYVLDMAGQGKVAARKVAEILNGEKTQNIPIENVANFYMFDWKQLQRWGLSERMLPAGSIVVNREPTLWQRARWIMTASLLVILGLALLVGYLLYKQRQLKLAREEQMRLSGMLINVQEDERGRIASELHDDFSQRLAVLSMQLETATEMIPEFPQEASTQFHDILNSASEIGADLHTLSHRLHSAALEKLGLIAGVSAFCNEFSARREYR